MAPPRKQPPLRQVWGSYSARGSPPAVDKQIAEIQAHVFQRRLRVKDNFLDFDPLHCGRCTPEQFMRAVKQLVPNLPPSDSEALMLNYVEEGPQVMRPQIVNYTKFAKSIEQVFTRPDLESKPTAKVPRPGEILAAAQESKIPPLEQDPAMEDLLRRIALLVKTRGVVFRVCFQDCERSDSTSLMCKRYGGKVTEPQFRQHFPFTLDISHAEMESIVNRYQTETEDVDFLALEKDLLSVVVDPPSPTIAAWTDRCSLSSSRRFNQKAGPPSDVDTIEKIKSVVEERRLRLHGSFLEFDKLRRGVCSLGQVRTVFTILNIELSSQEFETLGRIFADSKHSGFFNYRDFCSTVNTVPLNDAWTHMTPAALMSTRGPTPRGHGGGRPRPQDNDVAEALLEEVESWISCRMAQRRLPLKNAFQDFDTRTTGKVTKTQFLRIMDNLRVELTRQQIDLLMRVYCDNGKDFAYLDFVKSVDVRSDSDYFDHLPYYPERPASVYFSRKGQVRPMLTPLDSSRIPAGQRPCTR